MLIAFGSFFHVLLLPLLQTLPESILISGIWIAIRQHLLAVFCSIHVHVCRPRQLLVRHHLRHEVHFLAFDIIDSRNLLLQYLI